MPNPWQHIDKLIAQHRNDLSRARSAVSAAKATSLKVLETGIWRCRFRPFNSAPVDVRGHSASELIDKLGALAKERTAARESAAKAREQARRAHREAVARTRAELKELGATRFKVRRVGEPPYRTLRWMCSLGRKDMAQEFDEASGEELVVAVRKHRDGRSAITPGAAQKHGRRVHYEDPDATPVSFKAG